MSANGNGVSPFVQIEGVSKWFGELQVLDNVSLAVGEHNVVCLIGASGSGKSTLLRCLNLLERVEEGEITIDGQRITHDRVDVNALRRKIGIVFQAYNLFPHMTVLQNVMLAPRKARGLSRDDAEVKARRLLQRIGLEEKADEYPDRLSGGQQQRVAIVRALAMEPKLMLLDEITSALDPQLVSRRAQPRARARRERDDDDRRDARDGLRARGRRQGLLPRRRPHPRGGRRRSRSSPSRASPARASFSPACSPAGGCNEGAHRVARARRSASRRSSRSRSSSRR